MKEINAETDKSAEINLLQEEVQRLRNVIYENDEEINRLNVYILEHKKLRVVYKDLLRAIDNSLSVRLKERTKKKRYYPPIKPADLPDEAKGLYEAVSSFDNMAFSHQPSFLQKISQFFFSTIFTFYCYLKKGLKAIFRGVKKAVKRPTRRVNE